MKIELDGLRATVDLTSEQAWEVLRFAAELGARAEINDDDLSIEGTSSLISGATGHAQKAPSEASRLREVACEVLADGKFHTRRKLTAAARAAGLRARNLDHALRGERFEKNMNVEGDPVYRDLEAPTPSPATATPPDLPDDEIEVIGSLNGSGSDA